MENKRETTGQNTRFRAVQWMYRIFREMVSADIRQTAAMERGMMGYNLSHSMNRECFDEGKGRSHSPPT